MEALKESKFKHGDKSMAAISRSRNIIDFNSNGGVTVFFNYGRYK